jgi:hypothetical protein
MDTAGLEPASAQGFIKWSIVTNSHKMACLVEEILGFLHCLTFLFSLFGLVQTIIDSSSNHFDQMRPALYHFIYNEMLV